MEDFPHKQLEEYDRDREQKLCTDPSCARCGSSMTWIDCEMCGGEGVDGHDCGEDCCCCIDPEDNVPCDACRGRGGWWQCMSNPVWCEAHPLPGREKVPVNTSSDQYLDESITEGETP
jgi:hypothetical protein